MSNKDMKATMTERIRTWERDHEKTVARSPERSQNFTLSEGTPIKPLYTPLDMEGNSFLDDISFPGQYPYTRGVYASGYRTQLWNIQQVSGYSLADDTNKRLKQLKAHRFLKPLLNRLRILPRKSMKLISRLYQKL